MSDQAKKTLFDEYKELATNLPAVAKSFKPIPEVITFVGKVVLALQKLEARVAALEAKGIPTG